MAVMNITDAALQRAVLSIYNELNVPSGGRLQLTAIEQAWPKTGLRYGDLARGVESLLEAHLLELLPGTLATPRNPACLKLTAAGYAAMVAPVTQGFREQIKARYQLAKAKRRLIDIPTEPTLVNRRRMDRMLANSA